MKEAIENRVIFHFFLPHGEKFVKSSSSGERDFFAKSGRAAFTLTEENGHELPDRTKSHVVVVTVAAVMLFALLFLLIAFSSFSVLSLFFLM